MCKIQKLKDLIVELKLDLVDANIPYGNCPYAYYRPSTKHNDCGEIDCDECRKRFLDDMKKEIVEEVKNL